MKNIDLIFLSCSLLLLVQTCNGVKAGFICDESEFSIDGSYVKNRNSLLSSLSQKVIKHGGFYNTSRTTRTSRRVYAVALCRRGYDPRSCIDCVEKVVLQIKEGCPNKSESFNWDGDDRDTVLCLVRTTIHSTFRKLQRGPAKLGPSPVEMDPSFSNMSAFRQEWESMVNRTIQATTGKAKNSTTVLKYYGAVKAQFTEFPNVYMMMQCTPDITSRDCKICLRDCVTYFRSTSSAREGGTVSRPSCFFRWERYEFYGAFAELTRVPAPPGALIPRAHAASITGLKGRIAIIVVPTVINIFVLIGLLIACGQMRKSKKQINGRSVCVRAEQNCDSNGQMMLRFDLDMILTATDDFSSKNKLGEGGFGTVYKGALSNGQEIAVKRLAQGSGQGDLEFKNEVLLLTRLQHRNLVKLLGFCDEGDEGILIYDFIPNSSLDNFIFHEEKRLLLTWELRCKIIEGVARGLLYLHEDSQLKIIHRDLKPSNILLDAEMNPKVSDFGLARLFDTHQTRGVTSRVVGTYGYMAPEYVKNGRISVKTDVYSFGVVLLEMITGKSNKTYFEACGLPAYTWKCWVAGEAESIIDPVLSKSPTNEIMRFIDIGLLCVQDNVANRPTMSLVIQWLGGETIAIPLPTAAAFTTNLHINSLGTDPSTITESEAGASSLNEVSIISEFSPR